MLQWLLHRCVSRLHFAAASDLAIERHKERPAAEPLSIISRSASYAERLCRGPFLRSLHFRSSAASRSHVMPRSQGLKVSRSHPLSVSSFCFCLSLHLGPVFATPLSPYLPHFWTHFWTWAHFLKAGRSCVFPYGKKMDLAERRTPILYGGARGGRSRGLAGHE